MSEIEFYTAEDARRTGLHYGADDAKKDASRGTKNALGMLLETVRWVTDHIDDEDDEPYRREREESYLLAYVTTWARLAAEKTNELTETDDTPSPFEAVGLIYVNTGEDEEK